MTLTDLMPWNNRSRSVSSPQASEQGNPFLALHREMNRMFDDFARGFVTPSLGGGVVGWPQVEVTETNNEVKVVAELPGIDQKDVEIEFANGILTIRGEKKSENNNAQYTERWQGKFQRSLQLGPDVDPERVNATFANGVLTITLPKRPEAQNQVKRIPISAG